MPLVLDGTNGVSGVDGTASNPAIEGTDSNTGIFYPAADTVAIGTGGVQRVTADSSGNLRLNTSTGELQLAVGAERTITPSGSSGSTSLTFKRWNGSAYVSDVVMDGSGNFGLGISSPLSFGAGYAVVSANSSTGGAIAFAQSGTIKGSVFSAGNDVYIDRSNSAGNLYFRNTGAGRTDATITSGGGFESSSYVKAANYLWAAGSGAGAIGVYLGSAGSDNGRIAQTSSGTGTTTTYIGNQAITTSSDIRLKENVSPTERNALELLQQWEIVDHTWNDPSDQAENNRNSRGVWTGVVAQQVQPITPWLVNKPLEETNEDGSINPWTMDFGYAVPLLVKAIQELNAKVEAQAAEIAALKGNA